MLNGFLVGGANLPSWKMMEFVNGKDYPVYEMENKKCLKPPWYTIPLWKILKKFSHLGWWHSQLNGKIKLMFQTTNQMFFTMEKLRFDLPVCHLWFTRKRSEYAHDAHCHLPFFCGRPPYHLPELSQYFQSKTNEAQILSWNNMG